MLLLNQLLVAIIPTPFDIKIDNSMQMASDCERAILIGTSSSPSFPSCRNSFLSSAPPLFSNIHAGNLSILNVLYYTQISLPYEITVKKGYWSLNPDILCSSCIFSVEFGVLSINTCTNLWINIYEYKLWYKLQYWSTS